MSADAAALDLDDDGVPDAFFTDGGRGLWEKATSGPGERPAPVPPPSPRPPDVSYDLDDDGFAANADFEVPDALIADAESGVSACPMSAIRLLAG